LAGKIQKNLKKIKKIPNMPEIAVITKNRKSAYVISLEFSIF